MNNQKADIYKAAAIFIDNQGRLLISKDKGSDKWQMLGGKIEKGESHIEC
jgi:8-oxo-dGTP pyrophosphatase MutT (NUDIX family)